jgi:amino acid transporter
MEKYQNPSQNRGSLGTFAGVFTPSILTILGIILFLRLGYVIGSAGLMYGLIIITLANGISVLTSFSLAAIATNLRVKGGGDYYLISRTLGFEYGGALGLVLFLAQSVSIAFYCIGFGESIAGLLGSSTPHLEQLIAAVAVCFLFSLSWFGADLATKFQYLVMAFLLLALASFYLGGFQNWNTELLLQSWQPPENHGQFWILFAIFFPAVTGFTQGVSMSGDLQDPSKSLPLGTFWAVSLSILVYFTVAVIFAASRPLPELQNNFRAMGEIAFWHFLIDAGVIAATLSSAMASFLGAPRILQSLSRDKIFSFLMPFAKGYGKTDNPRRGVILSAVIAIATIALGQLDLIARLVSMFFLISYGLLNYATYYEARAASPSFRPRFRWYHYNLSLAGFLACLGVMLAIDLPSGVTAIAILLALYQYLKRTTSPARWADGQRSHHLQRVRTNLLAADSDPDHPRDWRPYILAFSDTQERRGQLLEFAKWLEGGSGLTTVVRFLTGEGATMRKARQEAADEMVKEVKKYRKDVFTKVVSGPSPDMALDLLLQSFGLGPIQANTILMNWIEDKATDAKQRTKLYGRYLRHGHRMGCHIVILCTTSESWKQLNEQSTEGKTIDVWWRGDASSRLMLLLAYLATREEKWRDARIRVLAVNYSGQNKENAAELQQRISESRIEAESIIIDNAGHASIMEYSAESALTFLPFVLRDHEPTGIFGNPVNDSIDNLGVTALVLAGQDVALDAEPEEGTAGLLAAALDNLERATIRAKKAEEAAEKAAELAKQKMEEIELSGGVLDDELSKKLKSAIVAREKADKAAQKYAREQAKLQDASQQAEEHGLSAKTEDTEGSEQERMG